MLALNSALMNYEIAVRFMPLVRVFDLTMTRRQSAASARSEVKRVGENRKITAS